MSKLLSDAGRALYGERWQTDLANALGVSDRTVRRWVSGVDDPRPGVYLDLLRLTQERAAELEGLADRLQEAGTPA